jgi:hypothetical protein
MTGLFIALDDYIIDPIEEEVMRAMIEDEYIIIPSKSNIEGWERRGRPINSANLHSR